MADADKDKKTISQFTYLAPSVFAFYMIVTANFLPELLGCRMQHVLRTNMYAKHFTGLVLLFFLVVLVNPAMSSDAIWKVLLTSVVIYVWFLMTTRAPFTIACLTVLLLLGVYIVNIRREQMVATGSDAPDDKAFVERLEAIQYAMIATSVIISVVGFVVYAIEKSREYGDDFELLTFIFGNAECRNFTPNAAKVL
jgi:uncharacterized membrane protein YobD (UPF0266 family)